jgi:hypothetical protein
MMRRNCLTCEHVELRDRFMLEGKQVVCMHPGLDCVSWHRRMLVRVWKGQKRIVAPEWCPEGVGGE